MPINLSKGQKVDLTKKNPGLKKIMAGLGWDVNAFDSGSDFDLDAAAFMLGAKAVQMGTRFVATEECHVHENYKQFLLKARDIDTRVTGRTTGHPVRTLRNPMTKEYLEKEAAGASFEELEMLTLGGLRKAVVDGDVKTGSVMSGQIAGMVNDVPTCKELMARLIRETKETVEKNSFLVEE